MSPAKIIFVPGKNPKPPADQHRQLLWKALLEGVRRAEPDCYKDLKQHFDHFRLISWNYLYYHSYKDISRELSWIDVLINKHGPTEQDIREAHAWHLRFDRFFYSVVDHLPGLLWLLPAPIRSAVEETKRYFFNGGNIAREIRELLKVRLRQMLANNDRILLVGHSMGSIISYDTLWELSHEDQLPGKIDMFLTLGSPLGLNYVQSRLKGNQQSGKEKYPSNINRWVNISSEGDVTALDRVFSDDFSEMLELGMVESIEDHCQGIYNFYHNEDGLNCHRSYGYLVNPAVGKVIADWWQKPE